MSHELRHRDDLPTSLRSVLAQRGFVWSSCCDKSQVIDAQIYSSKSHDRWLESLANSTTRKLLRKLVAETRGATRPQLAAICAEPMLSQRLSLFEEVGILRQEDDIVYLTRNVDSFGHTLEWYVAYLVSRSLNAEAAWGAKIEDVYGGGDFDVLAWLDSMGALLYIECKSKAPDDVTENEIRNFLQRSQELAPESAIFLVDTDSPVADLVNRFNDILTAVQVAKLKPQPRFPGIYYGCGRVYLTGSMPSLLTQIQKCLRHYTTSVKGAAMIWGEPRDYIRGQILES